MQQLFVLAVFLLACVFLDFLVERELCISFRSSQPSRFVMPLSEIHFACTCAHIRSNRRRLSPVGSMPGIQRIFCPTGAIVLPGASKETERASVHGVGTRQSQEAGQEHVWVPAK